MSNNLCLYHASCADGFAAALVVSIFHNDDCEFQAMQYGDESPNVEGKNVIIVDFSFKRDVLLEMKLKATSLIVIDHHKTAQAELSGLDFCIFDMDKSGAVLTWEYFFPKIRVPLLFKYIQDRDLWNWELPKSKELSAGLRSYPMDFQVWKSFLSEPAIIDLKKDGSAILRYQERCVESALSHKIPMIEIGGYKVPCTNSTHLISEIGNDLCQEEAFAACYFDTDTKRIFSLRSADNGIDVSEIAKQYGGGGHRNAAGFTIERPKVI